MFRLKYKKPSSGEIRIPNQNYRLKYSNSLFLSVYTKFTVSIR